LSIFLGITHEFHAIRRRTFALRATGAVAAICFTVYFHSHPIAINNLSDNGHSTSTYALGPLQCLAEYGPDIETLHKMESTAKSREESRKL
jgi:hypothetical protein